MIVAAWGVAILLSALGMAAPEGARVQTWLFYAATLLFAFGLGYLIWLA